MQNNKANLSPQGIDNDILQPSTAFRKKVHSVTWALIFFILVYIVLSISGLIIAISMVVLGYFLLVNVQAFLTIVLGIGLILSGLMLIYFLVRSIFIKAPAKTFRYETTEIEQPDLFNFIKELTINSGAPFPKHIYLAPDVNASVFFDSSFWSMIFPVRKNLVIGMALVNCVNQSEFRAIMEHEFGHFSQRSMRFGSYVYNFNRVIHNTLYEDKSYDIMLRAWARWHYILRLTAMLNLKIIRIIQGTLRKMYVYINKTYLGLSREMEFHADAIAAYYGGANNMAAALRRIEAGDECYNKLLNILTQKMNEGYRSSNLYQPHLHLLRYYAEEKQLTIDDFGVPVIKDMAVLNNWKVEVKNPWSSHPSMTERETKLNEIGIVLEPVEKPASLLFKNIATIQEQLTAQMYQNVNAKYKELTLMDEETFSKDFEDQHKSTSYNIAYNGFYNNRELTEFDIDDAVALTKYKPCVTFGDLFTKQNCNLPKAISGMQNDIATLTNLEANSNTDVLKFDFEGTTYNKEDAGKIKEIITSQLEAALKKVESLDKDVFIFFYQLAEKKELKHSLVDQYKQAFNYQELSKPDYDNYNNLMKDLSPVYGRMKPDAIYDTMNRVYFDEKTLKPRIKEIMDEASILACLTDIKKFNLDTYLSKQWVYYTEPSYDNYAIEVLNNGLNTYISLISERNFQYKKSLFDFQLSLLDT